MRIPVFRAKATNRNMRFHQTNVSMCRIFAYAVLGLFLFPLYSQAQALLKRSPDSHRIIIKFRAGSELLKLTREQSANLSRSQTSRDLSSIQTALGIEQLRPLKPDATLDPLPGGVERIFIASLADSVDVGEALATARGFKEIEYAEPVSTAGEAAPGIEEMLEAQVSEEASGFPSDPYFPQQWALANTGQMVLGYLGKAGADLRMLPAWQITTGSSEVVVAFLSSGLRVDAFEFSGRVLRSGYNFVDESTDVSDARIIGTYITSVAAATGDNSYVMAGIDWNCRILPIKVATVDPTYGPPTVDRLSRGIVYAADQGANVICIPMYGEVGAKVLDDAITYAASRRVIIVMPVLSGWGRFDGYPESFQNVILVGGVDNRGLRYASYSGRIDFVAPAKVILGLQNENPALTRTLSGVPGAAALTTGVVSLMLSLDKSLSFKEVYDILKESATDQIGDPEQDKPGWDEYYGWGRINAYRALRIIQERTKAVPEAFGVSQNYPNPFNSGTVIQYELRFPMHVSITIYNVLGQPVVTLLDEEKQAGYHHVRWDANVASGVYIYRLNARPPSGSHAGERVIVKKMMLVK